MNRAENSFSLPRDRRLWLYVILPAVVLNIGTLIVYAGYYGVKYARPETVAGIPENRVNLITYGLIFVLEWLFEARRQNHWAKA